MYKRKFNAEGYYADRGALRMVNAGGNRSTTVRRGTTRRYKSIPKSFKEMVTRAVNLTEEKKESTQYSLNTPLPPVNNAGWTASSICLSPNSAGFVIAQGTGQGQRTGNMIRTKKAWVKGVIHPVQQGASNSTPAPYEIRMLIFKDKFNKSGQPASVALDLFQSGSTAIGPQNDLVDMILDVNKDRYQVYHDEVMKIGNASYTGSGPLPAFQFFANNDFSYNVKYNVDITKFIPKTIHYNDATTSPMNDTLWMIFLPVYANGSAVVLDQISNSMSWTACYQYTDA